ncbi:acetyltransferase [Legionella geestiana]|uniref:Acetyltransferase n=1 Tax=Legionella geestiana TaxID=45065 RepID=A0A0W0UA44_9GAMM|nr:GNAT family N-acetyltransferase [Legionella geestiana]KTD04820.1 acetyltransferase [Legionella geestiana]QBS11351.1 N-acetyltransferase [Legionella geestiana]STX53999.1 acetyltransferase [Legionella geestiana]
MNIIETERLILRTWEEGDVSNYYSLNQDPKVVEFLLNMTSISQAQTFIEKMNHQFHAHGYTLFALEEKQSGKLIGFAGLNAPAWSEKFTPCVEIGWRLSSAFWGNGYATEAAKAVLAYGFKTCALEEILAWTVPENFKSIRVMEKIGMARDLKSDFNHPEIPESHRLSKHILYRIKRK